MRWRRLLIIPAVCIAVIAIVVALIPREPKYDGRTLSEWLTIAAPGTNPDPESSRAIEAVHRIGTNGLPWLIKWMSYEPPRWKYRASATAAKLPQPIADRLENLIMGNEDSPNSWAEDGFEILGPEASAAVPDLLRMLSRDPDWFHMASTPGLRALADIGRTGAPRAIDVMTNRANSVALRATAARCVGYIDSKTNPAVPFLLQCLQERDVRLSEAAAESLAELHAAPDKVVPILTNLVQNSNPTIRLLSLDHLGAYGEAANVAAPAVFMRLDDPDAEVRQMARHTLYRIDPATLNTFPPYWTEAWLLKTVREIRNQASK
jgi:hypothetical protein